MAELADAHGSGPCGSNTLWVRLPSSALDLAEGRNISVPVFLYIVSIIKIVPSFYETLII